METQVKRNQADLCKRGDVPSYKKFNKQSFLKMKLIQLPLKTDRNYTHYQKY